MHLASVSVHVGEMFSEGPRAYRVSLGFSPDPVDLQGDATQFGEVLALEGGSTRTAVAQALREMADRLDLPEGREFMTEHKETMILLALEETRADIAAGRFVVESPAEHVARVQAAIEAEAKVSGPSQVDAGR